MANWIGLSPAAPAVGVRNPLTPVFHRPDFSNADGIVTTNLKSRPVVGKRIRSPDPYWVKVVHWGNLVEVNVGGGE